MPANTVKIHLFNTVLTFFFFLNELLLNKLLNRIPFSNNCK